ncbi:PIR protein [Plasmodium reichenowi]|uniref:PIR protein n=1 Tax=Plasmodium reichenowi TaxID=5854 RepID=A0A2P9DRX3_PLARE|nr:PIR protein [Plasmodium reichenowi]
MKVHYINILLFALPLNILEHNQRNHKSPTPHTQTNRSLCECDLYMPNYDNDAEMKRVMQQFEDRTSQRLHEYDERMKTTREKCKDQCDKVIQKIILKDKLEKQMAEKLTTLETKIDTDDIPACICEKSIADKVEKGCLRCGGILGAAMPELGAIGGTALYALNTWKDGVIFTATASAKEFGALAGKIVGDAQGKNIVIGGLKAYGIDRFCPDLYSSIGDTTPYYDAEKIINAIITKKGQLCNVGSSDTPAICQEIINKFDLIVKPGGYSLPEEAAVTQKVTQFVDKATQSATELTKRATKRITKVTIDQETALIEGGFNSTISSINAAIIAIEVIVLILVIIYLILRYRRKKQKKKKLQYIKLLEE